MCLWVGLCRYVYEKRKGRRGFVVVVCFFLGEGGEEEALCGGLTLPCRNVDKLWLTAVAVADSPSISTITLERCFHY